MSLYIRVFNNFYTHRKTARLYAMIGDSAYWVVPRIWAYCAQNQPDGILEAYSASELALLIGYNKDATSMLEALVKSGFLDQEPLRIHDWDVHNGYHKKYSERAKTAAQARWSETSSPKPPSPPKDQDIEKGYRNRDKHCLTHACGMDERMTRLGEAFKRRATTAWDKKEIAAYKLTAAICDIDEFNLVLDYYKNSNSSYLRRDIKTLLNNWNGELDRARAWKEGRYENSQSASTPYSRPLTGAEQRQVGIPAPTGPDHWTLMQQRDERKRLAAEAAKLTTNQPGSGGDGAKNGSVVQGGVL